MGNCLHSLHTDQVAGASKPPADGGYIGAVTIGGTAQKSRRPENGNQGIAQPRLRLDTYPLADATQGCTTGLYAIMRAIQYASCSETLLHALVVLMKLVRIPVIEESRVIRGQRLWRSTHYVINLPLEAPFT